MSSTPSVFQHYQKQIAISNPTPATVGVWSADVYVTANPIVIAAICSYDSAGAYSWSYVLNESFGASGATFGTRRDTFATQVEKYRLVYQSSTVHLDAAAVTNQGMIAVAQYPIEEVKATCDRAGTFFSRSMEIYNELPKTYSQLLSMPNSYTATAKEGAYAPYRLSRTHQKWRNARDTRSFIAYGNASALTSDNYSQAWPAGAPSGTTVSGLFPYGLGGMYTGSPATDNTIPQRMDSGVVHISFENLHYLSSFVLTLRLGMELQVSPGSPLMPFVKAPPPYDAQALDSYFAISRQLKDAYPEDYNGNGALLPLIANVAKNVLHYVPGGDALWSVGKGVWDIVKKKPSKTQEAESEKASIAQLEDRQAFLRAKFDREAKGLNSKRGRAPRPQRAAPPPPPNASNPRKALDIKRPQK